MIEGVTIDSLKQITDKRGKVMHMLRADSPSFTSFGEVYFSTVNYGMVKAWKRHWKMTQHLAVPVGKIKLVIYDNREESVTKGNIEIIGLGESEYFLVTIPPTLWYGFQGLSNNPALIVNCTDIPHDPNEVERCESDNMSIPFNWNVING